MTEGLLIVRGSDIEAMEKIANMVPIRYDLFPDTDPLLAILVRLYSRSDSTMAKIKVAQETAVRLQQEDVSQTYLETCRMKLPGLCQEVVDLVSEELEESLVLPVYGLTVLSDQGDSLKIMKVAALERAVKLIGSSKLIVAIMNPQVIMEKNDA